MRLLNRLLAPIAAILIGFALLPASASDKTYNATGCHAGIFGGYAFAHHDTNLGVPGMPIGLRMNGLSADSGEAGVTVGCDVRVTGTDFVVGAFGDWAGWRNLDHTTTLTIGPDNASARFGSSSAWTVGGRVGVIVRESVMIYALAGYTSADTDPLKLAVNGVTMASFGLGKLEGIVVGGGIEADLGRGFAMRGEYRHVRYDDIGAELIPGLLDLDIKTREHIARLAVIWRFKAF